MYSVVPTHAPAASSSHGEPSPRSISVTPRRSSTRMFSGLRSWWTWPRPWRAATAETTAVAIAEKACGVIGPAHAARRAASVGASMRSITT
jgi:hypothetical protein